MATKITSANFAPAILAAIVGPAISSVQIASDNTFATVLDDTAVPLAGGYIVLNGTGFITGCQVYLDSTIATTVTFVSSTRIDVQVPALAAGTYVLYLVNGDGSIAIRANGLTYSTSPVWSTTSELGSSLFGTAISLQLAAPSDSTITYTLQAGSALPTGLTLSSTGLLSGTVTIESATTYNFTVVATDTELQDSPRTFSVSITVGDPYFKNTTLLLNGETVSPTWLSDASTNNLLVTNRSDFRTNAAVIPTGRTPYNKTTYPTAGSAWFAGDPPDGPGAYDTLNYTQPAISTVFTMEMWIYPTSVQSDKYLYAGHGTGPLIAINSQMGLGLAHAGAFAFYTAANVLTANTWHHVAVVRTGTGSGECKMYLNGTLITLASGTFTESTTFGSQTATIGGASSGFQQLYRGHMADLRIVNGTAVYTGNFAAPAAPLTAISNTAFLALQYKQGTTNSGIVDDSTNGLPLIRTGNTTQGSFSPFSPTGWSAYYDGTGDYVTTSGFGLPTNFTVEFWTYFTLQPTGGYLTSASSSGPIIGMDASKTILGWNGSWILNPPNDSAVYPNGVAPLNQWNHWAVVRNSGTMTFYLNGIKLGSASGITNDATASQTFGIGSANDGSPVNVPFYMSNFRMSSVARYSGTNTTVANFTLPTADFVSDADTLFLTHQSNRFKDSGPNNRAVVNYGDTKVFAFSPFALTTAYSAATHGGSMYFDGTGDYLTTPPGSFGSTTLDTGAGTSDVTFECWVYNKGYSGSQYGRGIFTFYPNAGYGNSRFMFRLNNGGDQVNVFLYISGALPINTTSTALATPNAWTHLAFVRQSGTFKLYINGVLDFSSTGISASLNTFDKFDIGRNQDGSTPEFNGYISDFRYVKGTAVYTANFNPPTAPLIAITNTSLLLSGTNAGIFDATGRNDLETVGYTTAEPGRRQPEISTQVKKYGNSSMYFGGNGDYVYSGSSPNFELSAGDFTVEFWMYPTAVSGADRGIFGIGTTDPDSNLVRLNSSAKLQFWLGGSNGGGPGAGTKTGIITCTTTIVANTWAHVALVRSGSASNNVKLYLNGTQDGQGTATYNIGAKPFGLGMGYPGSAVELYTGYIDDFRITKGVARYTTNFTPPTALLTS